MARIVRFLCAVVILHSLLAAANDLDDDWIDGTAADTDGDEDAADDSPPVDCAGLLIGESRREQLMRAVSTLHD